MIFQIIFSDTSRDNWIKFHPEWSIKISGKDNPFNIFNDSEWKKILSWKQYLQITNIN